MNNIARAGWICACLGLVAPASTFAESVSVMHGAYEASLVRFTPAPDEAAAQAPAAESLFSFCHRCSAPDASPFLVSTGVSAMSASGGGSAMGASGGFSQLFGGMLTLPLPGLNATVAVSSGASVTMPFPAAADDHHAVGGSPAAPSHSSSSVAGGFTHGGSIAGGALSATHAALSKAESLAATPEPASLVLLGIGLIGVASRRGWRTVS